MFSNSFKYCNSLLLVLFLAFAVTNFLHVERNGGKLKTFQKKNSENAQSGFEKYELNTEFSDSEMNDENDEYFTFQIPFSLKIKTNYFSENIPNYFFSHGFFTNVLSLYDLFCEWQFDC